MSKPKTPAEEQFLNINHARRQVATNLQEKKFDRDNAALELKNWTWSNDYEPKTVWERRQIGFLQQALDELYGSKKQRDIDICLEEEEINDLLLSKRIRSLRNRIRHGCNKVVDEKRIIRETKEAEAKRGKAKPKIVDYFGLGKSRASKEVIETRIKDLSDYLSRMRTVERESYKFLKRYKEKAVEEAENEVRRVQEELDNLTRIRDEAYDNMIQLKSHAFY